MKNIGLIIIATNKYANFIPELISSAMSNFMTKHNVTYYIFTNNKFLLNIESNQIKTIPLSSQPFPMTTLLRYNVIDMYNHIFINEDYLFQIDADMLFVNKVEDEILVPLIGVEHPGFINQRGTPETNIESTAFIKEDKNITYCMGAFTGGEREKYLEMSKTISINVGDDLKKEIIAIWWDESHLNKYLSENNYVCINSAYCYSSIYNLPYEPKIITLEKDHKIYQV